MVRLAASHEAGQPALVADAGRLPFRDGAFDLAVPANRVRLEAVRDLGKLAADAGMPLTHLATAFVRSHPAVTSVLIGPRTAGQLDDLLAGADVELSEDVLDR